MRATVAYFTRGGRSEHAAQALANELGERGVDVELVRLTPTRGTSLVGGALLAALRVPSGLTHTPDLNGVDLLGLVGPVWAGSITPAMRSMMDALHDIEGRPVVSIVCGLHACTGVAARVVKALHARNAGLVASRAVGRSVLKDPHAIKDLARELCAEALQSTRP